MVKTKKIKNLLNVTRQIHEGAYLISCIKQSFDEAIYFKLVELSLFSTRASSKLHFLSFFNITLKTYPSSVST